MVKTRVIRFLLVIEGQNARDQIALRAFHSLLVEVPANAGHIHMTQCVIRTSGLGLRAPLVARNNYVKTEAPTRGGFWTGAQAIRYSTNIV